MSRTWRLSIALAILAALAAAPLYWSLAREKADTTVREEKKADTAETAAIRKQGEEFVKAFNAGDSKAVAAFWTKDGEYVGLDGEVVRGRAAIEKDYIEFFKNNPKAKIALNVETIRLLGAQTALEEGTLTVRQPGDREPARSRYSVVHVREGDKWLMGVVREVAPNPGDFVSLKDIDWLVGEWVAKTENGEARTTYEWDEDKTFLRGRFTVKKGKEIVSSGTQILARDAAEGGLRSWLFEKGGTFGESLWTRDEDRWVIEASGTLPDGTVVSATNILIPLDKDSFTWQSVDRRVGDMAMPDVAPVKVTRVKADK